jgi:hypothetical protein
MVGTTRDLVVYPTQSWMGIELKESGFCGTFADVQGQLEERPRESARAIPSQQRVPPLRTPR